MGLHVLGCRIDILGTNCKKLLKVKMSGGEGRGSRFSFSTCNYVRGAARRLLLDKKIKKDILSLGVHFTAEQLLNYDIRKKKKTPKFRGVQRERRQFTTEMEKKKQGGGGARTIHH